MRAASFPEDPVANGSGFGVIIAAGGSGERVGLQKKQFYNLRGRPLLHYSLDVFARQGEVVELVVVAPGEDLDRAREVVSSWQDARATGGAREESPSIRVIAGGDSRQASVKAGIGALGDSIGWVLVHDAVRPLVTTEDVHRVIEGVKGHGAAAIGHPVTDSIREENGGKVVAMLDRQRLWQVQTPQGASREVLEKALDAPGVGSLHTDEISLLQEIGVNVRLVEGSRENLKITLPGDLDLAEYYLTRRQGMV